MFPKFQIREYNVKRILAMTINLILKHITLNIILVTT